MKFGIIIVVLMLFNMLGHVDAFRPAIHKNGVVSTLGILPVNPSCIPIAATSFGSPTHSRSNYQLCKKENLLLMLDLVDRPCFIPADATKTVAVRSNFLQNTFKKFTGFFRKILGWLYSCFRVSNYIRTRPSLNQSSSAVGTSSSDFIALSSTPINKIPNINAGRIYAQAKLQEIEQYLTRGKVMAVASSSSSSSASGGKRKYTTHESSEKHTLKRSVDDLLDEEVRDKRYVRLVCRFIFIIFMRYLLEIRCYPSLSFRLIGMIALCIICSYCKLHVGTESCCAVTSTCPLWRARSPTTRAFAAACPPSSTSSAGVPR